MEIDPNVAVDLVMLSKTDTRIDFEKITKVIECDDNEKESENEDTDESTESDARAESTE